MNQITIFKQLTLTGIGVHSGQPATIKLSPAEPNSGIVIKNKNFLTETLSIGSIIPEAAMHATVLKSKSWAISTIEHLLAAISALMIDNIIIEIDSKHPLCECPIFDGSSLPFVQAFNQIGLKNQAEPKKFLTPRRSLIFEADGRHIEILPAKPGSTELTFEYSIDFEHPLVKSGSLKTTLSPDFFAKEISPARTFGFLKQLPLLRKHGLANGTTLGNTVVVGEDIFLNSLRFEDEFVRHKLLDLIGDLALLGKPLIGTVRAHKTGHAFNRKVVEHYIQNPEHLKI